MELQAEDFAIEVLCFPKQGRVSYTRKF